MAGRKPLTTDEEAMARLLGVSSEEVAAMREAQADLIASDMAFHKAHDAKVQAESLPLTKVVALVGMRVKTLRKLVRDGKGPAFKHKGRWRIWDGDGPRIIQLRQMGFW